MIKRIAIIFGLLSLVAYPFLLWSWSLNGFPIEINACQHYAQSGECDHRAPEYIYLFLFRKIGEAASDSVFVTAIATVLLAFITLGLVVVGHRQSQTSRAQLRAYIVAYATGSDPKPGKFVAYIQIKNAGQTPAYGVTVISKTCALLHPPGKDFDYSVVDPGNPSNGMLGPGLHVSHESHLVGSETTPEEVNEATTEKGWLRIYTYGTVKYLDVFKNPQWTNFCLYHQWDDTSVAGVTSEHHNDAS